MKMKAVRMQLAYQRGALSLLWCAVFAGLFTFAAMALLSSWRYERNIFAEGWSRLMHTAEVQTLRKTADRLKSDESAAIRQCTVNGKVTYSNVECNAKNATSRKVDLHDTQGIEQPKVLSPDVVEKDAPADLRNKIIEKAISR